MSSIAQSSLARNRVCCYAEEGESPAIRPQLWSTNCDPVLKSSQRCLQSAGKLSNFGLKFNVRLHFRMLASDRINERRSPANVIRCMGRINSFCPDRKKSIGLTVDFDAGNPDMFRALSTATQSFEVKVRLGRRFASVRIRRNQGQ